MPQRRSGRTSGCGLNTPSYTAVLGSRGFRALWIAQICAQLAQNLTWLALGAYVAHIALSGKNTAVAAVTLSAMVAQLFLSGFAGVIVDRASKRRVLTRSNLIRVVLTLLLVPVTWLDVGLQLRAIILLILGVYAQTAENSVTLRHDVECAGGDAVALLVAHPAVSGNTCLATGLGHTALRPAQRAKICTENPAALATMRKPALKGFPVRACWTWIWVTEFSAVWAYTPMMRGGLGWGCAGLVHHLRHQ